mmetsp:Transcript_25982/g.66986  ORF Transcript_25982/g.66986 Transcript_25982/m.66986 type:complete len:141 (+) Transcript_25982:661-1083(+)
MFGNSAESNGMKPGLMLQSTKVNFSTVVKNSAVGATNRVCKTDKHEAEDQLLLPTKFSSPHPAKGKARLKKTSFMSAASLHSSEPCAHEDGLLNSFSERRAGRPECGKADQKDRDNLSVTKLCRELDTSWNPSGSETSNI